MEDAKHKCLTYKCVPVPPPVPGRCEREKTKIVDDMVIIEEDECGHVILEPKCPEKVHENAGCHKGEFINEQY